MKIEISLSEARWSDLKIRANDLILRLAEIGIDVSSVETSPRRSTIILHATKGDYNDPHSHS